MSKYHHVQVGEKYGLLMVISELPNRTKCGKRQFTCICECGNQIVTVGTALTQGKTKSCGCYKRKRIQESNTKHGMSHTKLNHTYRHIKDRCLNQNCASYENYGGRGIKICDDWKNDFSAFAEWAMLHGYEEGLTIERIDNDGDYEPSNCKWIPKSEQPKNRRTCRYVELDGEKHTISEWARITGINRGTLSDRLKRGWTPYEAIVLGRKANENWADIVKELMQ